MPCKKFGAGAPLDGGLDDEPELACAGELLVEELEVVESPEELSVTVELPVAVELSAVDNDAVAGDVGVLDVEDDSSVADEPAVGDSSGPGPAGAAGVAAGGAAVGATDCSGTRPALRAAFSTRRTGTLLGGCSSTPAADPVVTGTMAMSRCR